MSTIPAVTVPSPFKLTLPECSSKPPRCAHCHSTLLPTQPWYRRERRLKTAETRQLKWIAIVFLAVSLAVRNLRRRQS